jgi:hypothetical protein
MRLLKLKDNGKFSLTEDFINDKLPYAILSHTWECDNEEVTFKDLMESSRKAKAGYTALLESKSFGFNPFVCLLRIHSKVGFL